MDKWKPKFTRSRWALGGGVASENRVRRVVTWPAFSSYKKGQVEASGKTENGTGEFFHTSNNADLCSQLVYQVLPTEWRFHLNASCISAESAQTTCVVLVTWESGAPSEFGAGQCAAETFSQAFPHIRLCSSINPLWASPHADLIAAYLFAEMHISTTVTGQLAWTITICS